MVLEELPDRSVKAEDGKVLQGKRKPFVALPTPGDISDKSEVFVIRETKEVFKEYDAYLKRFDDLKQKKFVDSVNGKSCLSYFDALESEKKSSTAIEDVFPDVLRDPILRDVQFSQTSRMDELVNLVFDQFKHTFFPGERVRVDLRDGTEPQYGIIREKAVFPTIKGPRGEVQRPSFARHFVRLDGNEDEEALVDGAHLRRDRRVFTKQNLRHFLKNSLQRESWIGAPWLVKEHLAIQYRLPMEIPAHLLQDARLLASKQQMLQSKGGRGRKKHDDAARTQQQELAQMQIQQQFPGMPLNQVQQIQQMQHNAHMRELNPPMPTDAKPAPNVVVPVIKFPIDDVDVPRKQHKHHSSRPQLQFLTPELETYVKQRGPPVFADIKMESVGHLLDVWDLLNVQCETYVLDSFTFDDCVEALRFQSTDTTCELLEEMHCSVLKVLVDKDGVVKLTKAALRDVIPEDSSSSEDEQDESEVSTPLPDAPARSTRSSMRLSYVDPAADNPRSPTAVPENANRASELLGDQGWVARLAERDFRDGGWQVIMAGILHQITAAYPSGDERRTTAERALAFLVPKHIEPTRESVRLQYAKMDINLRVSALQIICNLSVQTRDVREGLEQCNEDMTHTRKEKTGYQTTRKALVEELQLKYHERKALQPEDLPAPESPKRQSLGVDSTNGSIDDSGEVNGAGSPEGDEDGNANGRGLRRADDRKRKRDEDAARKAELKEKKVKLSKEARAYQKICAEYDQLEKQLGRLDREIHACDKNLREADVQRTKSMGQDRYCNTYWWFEHNGQPFFGLPSSSTADYGYANGRLWVQGPSEAARPLMELNDEEQKNYVRDHGKTLPERRRQDEGETMLISADEWGYISEPAALDTLINWLDDRGHRERHLRRELQKCRNNIAETMEALKKFQGDEEMKKAEDGGEQEARVSTRNKAQEDQAAKERCLRWRNNTARNDEESGYHIHSEPPLPKKKAAAKKQQKGVAVPLNRQGKPVTRQGV